jgi:DNA-binding transcriptional regulator YiaG
MGRKLVLTLPYTIGIVPGVDGAELRRLRIRARLTQAALAAKLGVAANSVARWERNERAIAEPMARLIVMTLESMKPKGKGA